MRITARVLIVVLLSASGLFAATQSVSASGSVTTWRYAQFNLWGNVGWSGATDPATLVVYYTAFQSQAGMAPTDLSLQEICRNNASPSQWQTMAGGLGTLGYYGAFFQLVTPSDSCPQFGIGTFGFATSPPGAPYLAVLGAAGGEPRGVICEALPIFGALDTSCSTHIGANSQLVPMSNDVASYSAANPGSLARYLGGDFNASWSTVIGTSGGPFTNRLEADQGTPPTQWYTWSTRAVDGGLHVKFDYSFVDNPGAVGFFWTQAQATPHVYTTANPLKPYSDHALLEGYFSQLEGV